MDAVPAPVKAAFDLILKHFRTFRDNFIEGLNKLIRGINNLPGVNLPTVSGGSSSGGGGGGSGSGRGSTGGGGSGGVQAQHGGTFLRQGLAFVGENGPELAEFPRFTRIKPLDETPPLLGSSGGGGIEINIHLHDVDLSEGSRHTLERIREGLREMDLESL
jgi:hypothetical protein